MSNVVSFRVSYDGAALSAHMMDVRDLAPALLSIGQLFDEANRVLNGKDVSLKLHVKAHQAGSFEILFEAAQSLSSQLSGWLIDDCVTSALNLKELLIGGGVSLFWLLKKLKGKNPQKITVLKNDYALIESEDKSFEVPLSLLRLYQDMAVRSATEQVLKPLENNGIDTFTVKDNDHAPQSVDKLTYGYFKCPAIQDEKILEVEHEAAYSIISLAFKEDTKWRLYDGNSTITVSIGDENFLRKVNENLIAFAKGDILMCTVKVSQWKTTAGLRTEYEVLEVKDHQHAARQIPLFNNFQE